MLTIRRAKTARIGPLKMYREDLNQLMQLFSDYCTQVQLTDSGNHRFSDLEDYRTNMGLKIKDLDIRGENPGVHLLLNQKVVVSGPGMPGPPTTTTFSNELRTEDISDDADMVYFKIKEFLSSYERPNAAWLLLPAFLSMLFGILTFVFAARPDLVPYRTVLILTSMALLALALYLVTLTSKLGQNVLILETRLNSPSFWKRKKDDLLLALFTGLLGAVLGIVGTLLAEHWIKK